jgi:hypothetical protein
MNSEAIYQALITRLKTVSDLPPLQLENTVIQARSSFSRATLMRPRPATLTIGITGKDLHQDIMQVDIFHAVNTGTEAAASLADAVIAAFPRGLELTAGDTIIHIRKSFRETAVRLNDQLHNTPVVIELAYTA